MGKLFPKKQKKAGESSKLLVEEHIAGFFLLIMLVLSFINIISRVVSGFSFAFTEEITVYLFVCSTFFGISAGVVHDLHLSVTILSDLIKKKKWWGLELAIEIINIVAVVLLFTWLGKCSVELCIKQIEYEYATPVLQIPTWIFTSSMAIGSVFFLYRSIIKFVATVKRIAKKEEEEENLIYDGVKLELHEEAGKEDKKG